MKFGISVCLAILIGGCATKPEPAPYPMTGEAPTLNPANEATVSGDIGDAIAKQLKPTDGTISIGGNNPAIDKDISVSLKSHGYRLALRNAKHAVSYIVEPLGPALLVRLRVDDVQIARMYRSGAAGELVPATPISVTEG